MIKVVDASNKSVRSKRVEVRNLFWRKGLIACWSSSHFGSLTLNLGIDTFRTIFSKNFLAEKASSGKGGIHYLRRGTLASTAFGG